MVCRVRKIVSTEKRRGPKDWALSGLVSSCAIVTVGVWVGDKGPAKENKRNRDLRSAQGSDGVIEPREELEERVPSYGKCCWEFREMSTEQYSQVSDTRKPYTRNEHDKSHSSMAGGKGRKVVNGRWGSSMWRLQSLKKFGSEESRDKEVTQRERRNQRGDRSVGMIIDGVSLMTKDKKGISRGAKSLRAERSWELG